MNRAPFVHIGGAVVSDHGPIVLAWASRLAGFYASEARLAADAGASHWAAHCRDRARALAAAAEGAALWRRAAGWADPRDADEGRSVLFRNAGF